MSERLFFDYWTCIEGSTYMVHQRLRHPNYRTTLTGEWLSTPLKPNKISGSPFISWIITSLLWRQLGFHQICSERRLYRSAIQSALLLKELATFSWDEHELNPLGKDLCLRVVNKLSSAVGTELEEAKHSILSTMIERSVQFLGLWKCPLVRHERRYDPSRFVLGTPAT